MGISAIILTKNEEKNIEACIKALQGCEEIIVIDDNSNDKTTQIAKKLGATVFIHSLQNNFSDQRNFGLEKAKNEWVLFIDADERVSKALSDEILQTIQNPFDPFTGYFTKRTDILWEKELRHGEVANIKLLRLAKKSSGKWQHPVHETWNIKGQIGELKKPLLHYPHQSIAEFLKELNFYTDLRAKELYDQKITSSFLSIIFYTKGKFFVDYFYKLGFLDGIPGLIVAILMSFHSFLVRGKLWLLWQKK